MQCFGKSKTHPKKKKTAKFIAGKEKQTVILKKIRQITLTKTKIFFTPRMIAAGIQNIVMVVGFVSY
jgi:hypothetical protein